MSDIMRLMATAGSSISPPQIDAALAFCFHCREIIRPIDGGISTQELSALEQKTYDAALELLRGYFAAGVAPDPSSQES